MDVLIFGILRYLTKETCKSDHIIICSLVGELNWILFSDWLPIFPVGNFAAVVPQPGNVFIDLETQSVRKQTNKQTNKHPRPNLAQPFFPKFSCVLQSSQEKLKTLFTLTQFCLGEENGGDKQVLLMMQRRLAGVCFSVLLNTLSLHVFFFNAFLFLVCPFWFGVGYDFRGNYGSGWTYLWF